jgi:hypothetical protein
MKADVFLARVKERVRLAGTRFEAAIEPLLGALSDDELDRLAGEFEQIMFGGDTAARDAAKSSYYQRLQRCPTWTNDSTCEVSNR